MAYKPKYFFFEFVPKQIRALGNDPLAFLEELTAEKYSLFLVVDSSLIEYDPNDLLISAENTDRDYNVLAKKTTIEQL